MKPNFAAIALYVTLIASAAAVVVTPALWARLILVLFLISSATGVGAVLMVASEREGGAYDA